MKESIVNFELKHAEIILSQWQKAAGEINAHLVNAAVMANHFHFNAVVVGKITKAKLLQFFKGKASRVLNRSFGKRTWWTDSGSVRFSFNEAAFLTRIEYVNNQEHPLIVWQNPNLSFLQ